MARGAGMRREAVAFDAPVQSADGYGGNAVTWQEQFTSRAEFRYQRGDEAVEAGGLTGTARFKVRIPAHDAARAVTTEYRMRDTRASVAYNIREVDTVTDRLFVWLVVESGVAI